MFYTKFDVSVFVLSNLIFIIGSIYPRLSPFMERRIVGYSC